MIRGFCSTTCASRLRHLSQGSDTDFNTSQNCIVRTLVVPEVPGSVRGDFRRFWAVLFNFGRFQRRNAPKTHLVSKFLGWYGTLFKQCTRIHRGDLECSDLSIERFARLGTELKIFGRSTLLDRDRRHKVPKKRNRSTNENKSRGLWFTDHFSKLTS